jgi:hypothetical protein
MMVLSIGVNQRLFEDLRIWPMLAITQAPALAAGLPPNSATA